MVAPKIAAIIAREALAKFGDQLPANVKETIGFIDNPKTAIQSLLRGEIKDRVKSEMTGDQHQLIENSFPRRPESDFASFRGEGLGGAGKGFERDFGYSGGGGNPRFDEAGMSLEAFKRGGKVKATAKSASNRADGIAQRGKTRGKIV